MAESAPDSYDAVPYDSLPFAQSHPARMCGMARLFGLGSPPLAKARVLELGCASGGNLLPLAMRYPDAQFIGADLSQVQIAYANKIKGELGARNVTFRQADILDMAKESEQYDYIIAHGVYSWVPSAVQDAMLELYARQLAPEGVGYISYNVYPGWKMREVVRDMMLFHAGHLTDPKARVAEARAILQYAGKLHAHNPAAFGRLVVEEAKLLMQCPDYYIYHEHLGPINRPCYFHEFVAGAAKRGLAYLGEAVLSDMLPDRYGADLANAARQMSNGDIVACEQYVDLLTNRAFRQTLLVHAGRSAGIKRELTADSFRNLHLSVQLKAGSPGTYVDAGNHQISANQPQARALLDRLVAASPYTVPFEELVDRVAAFAQVHGIKVDAPAYVSSKVAVLLGQGVATLYGDPMPRPSPGTAQVSAYTRWHASRGPLVTNALHDRVQLTPEQGSAVKAGGAADAARVAELIDLGVMV